MLAPRDEADLAQIIADAAACGGRLELRGGGSKAAMGPPDGTAPLVDMRGFAGVVDYDPAELVLTVRAGTRLADIEALVAARGQMLAFDPFDHGPIFGQPAGAATIGGIVAAGIAGSHRLASGGARDHLLGFTAVSGRGERFVGGGKVVKNVTGYDLSKLVTGSWGRLVALTEITLKVLPAPRQSATLSLSGLGADAACHAMATAMGSPADIAAAFHLPAQPDGTASATVFRVQGFGPSVAARCALLATALDDVGRLETQPAGRAEVLVQAMRTLAPLAGAATLWRLSTPARAFPGLVAALSSHAVRWLADWAGGLIWLAGDVPPATIRAAAAGAGGHAMLVRGLPALRASVPMLHPQPPVLAALEARVRRSFDPAGVFETGRFGEVGHAD